MKDETVVMELAFLTNRPVVWEAEDDRYVIIDLPSEEETPVARIDSFVAILDRPPPKDGEEWAPDRVAHAKMVRINNRSIEFRFDPPEIRYAYQRWVGDVPTVHGDVGLWEDTFEDRI